MFSGSGVGVGSDKTSGTMGSSIGAGTPKFKGNCSGFLLVIVPAFLSRERRLYTYCGLTVKDLTIVAVDAP